MRDKGQEARGKLLPCPFCGGEAGLEVGKVANADDVVIYINYDVHCLKCGADTKYYDTAAKAIEAWNRRENDHFRDLTKMVERAKVEKVTRVSSVIRTGRCGNCDYDVIDSYKHCPNCGAKLDWGGNE